MLQFVKVTGLSKRKCGSQRYGFLQLEIIIYLFLKRSQLVVFSFSFWFVFQLVDRKKDVDAITVDT